MTLTRGADISDPAQGSAEPADELTRLLGNIGITASSTPEEITSAIQSYLHSGVPANAAEPKPAYSDHYDTPGKRYDDAADYYDDPNIFSDEDVMSDIENVDSELMAGYAEQCENAADCISNNISGADFIQPSETDSMPYTEDMYALHEDNNKYFDKELVRTYYDRCEHAADCITNNISETDFIQAPKPYNNLFEHNEARTFSKNEQCLKDKRSEDNDMCSEHLISVEVINFKAIMDIVEQINKLLMSTIDHHDDENIYAFFDRISEKSRELDKMVKQCSERRCEEDDIDRLMDEIPPGCILISEEDLYDNDKHYDDYERSEYLDACFESEEAIGCEVII